MKKYFTVPEMDVSFFEKETVCAASAVTVQDLKVWAEENNAAAQIVTYEETLKFTF